MYLQYFLRYSFYIKEAPFDPSLFVDIRKRLSEELIVEMNDKIHGFSMERSSFRPAKEKKNDDLPGGDDGSHRGEVIFDATVCPQTLLIPPISDC